MSMENYWNYGGWVLRCYKWRGTPYIALYRGRRRLGVLQAEVAIAHEIAKLLGGTVRELGEVRETKTITVRQVTAYEPIEIVGNGWDGYDGPSNLAEIQEADANDPGWDERPDVKEE